jgi:hypothetical protein
MQAGTLVTCESKTHPVGYVRCVGVNRANADPGPAAGGFAVLKPLPEAMWGMSTTLKLSLRRLSVPSQAELEAVLEKEEAKLPAKLVMATKAMERKVIEIDAGRKLQECMLEVRLDSLQHAALMQSMRRVLTRLTAYLHCHVPGTVQATKLWQHTRCGK